MLFYRKVLFIVAGFPLSLCYGRKAGVNRKIKENKKKGCQLATFHQILETKIRIHKSLQILN